MHKKHILPLLLLVQIILVKIIAFFPVIVEEGYSKGLYLTITFITRNLFGFFPFSVGDIMYYVLIFLLLRWIWNHRKGFWNNWKNNGLTILSWFSIFYFFFHFLWGLNYYRVPLHEKLNIDKEYSLAELEAFTQKMIAQTNAVQLSITQNDSVVVVVPYSDTELFELAQKGYTKLPEELSDFKYQYKSVKASLFSYPLSYMGFGGYLNPFTNEAQVNILKPKYNSPLTICHEMAHQTGIGSESECNFIGFIAASKNEDVYFQYAAYSFITRYCLHNLEMMQEGKSEKYFETINKGVLKNFDENEQFWEKYHTPIDTAFEIFYDSFLKVNQQQDGLESYSKFVGLMIGYEKNFN
jgi:hypothetical protein